MSEHFDEAPGVQAFPFSLSDVARVQLEHQLDRWTPGAILSVRAIHQEIDARLAGLFSLHQLDRIVANYERMRWVRVDRADPLNPRIVGVHSSYFARSSWLRSELLRHRIEAEEGQTRNEQ